MTDTYPNPLDQAQLTAAHNSLTAISTNALIASLGRPRDVALSQQDVEKLTGALHDIHRFAAAHLTVDPGEGDTEWDAAWDSGYNSALRNILRIINEHIGSTT